MAKKAKLESSPVITREKIKKEKYLGLVESPEGVTHLVKIKLKKGGSFLVAGGACNTGMIGRYVRKIDSSLDEDLQELISDIEKYENGGPPSGELLAFYGSLVI